MHAVPPASSVIELPRLKVVGPARNAHSVDVASSTNYGTLSVAVPVAELATRYVCPGRLCTCTVVVAPADALTVTSAGSRDVQATPTPVLLPKLSRTTPVIDALA